MSSFLRSRRVLLPFATVMGAVYGAIELSNRRVSEAIVGFLLIAGFGAYLAWGRSEWVVAGSGTGDERQTSIGVHALVLTAHVTIATAVVGWLSTELPHGKYGHFGMICSVGGFTYLAALVVLSRRR